MAYKNKEYMRKYHKKYSKHYYMVNQRRIRKRTAEYQRKHRKHLLAKSAERHLKEMYGLNLEQFNILLNKQKGLCAICGKPQKIVERRTGKVRNLCVDHNHKTGQVRGLLCMRCDTIVGYFENYFVNPIIKNKIKQYLKGE